MGGFQLEDPGFSRFQPRTGGRQRIPFHRERTLLEGAVRVQTGEPERRGPEGDPDRQRIVGTVEQRTDRFPAGQGAAEDPGILPFGEITRDASQFFQPRKLEEFPTRIDHMHMVPFL